MKITKILALFALATGMFVSCFDPEDVKDPEVVKYEEFLAKVKKLEGNSYVVQKLGGAAETRKFDQKWSQWEPRPMTDPKTDQTTQYVSLSLEDADADGGTQGGGYFCLPESVLGKVQEMTDEFFKENPWASVMVFTFKDPAAGHTGGDITAKAGGDDEGGMFGNMKKDGSCKILVQETKAYSGNYQVLFYFEFHNKSYVWNPDLGDYGEYEEFDDGDYIMYGNAIVEEYFPPVRTFTLKPHEFYLGYGGAGQELEVEYEPANAKWDWEDLELASNTHIFTYYPSTHILKTTSDAHELGIQVKFQLKSNPNVYDYVYVDINQMSQ